MLKLTPDLDEVLCLPENNFSKPGLKKGVAVFQISGLTILTYFGLK